MFRRILIANRGEIARRIIRTCRERGIVSVLAYSLADKDSCAAMRADETVCIGPPSPLLSYLNIQALVAAAQSYRCDAIHPGYGFLSESPRFAATCEDAGIVFIGPTSQTMRMLGDKLFARKTARQAGISVIPGMDDALESTRHACSVAHDIGYPVLLKAASGGGGRGIRRVNGPEEMAHSFHQAETEANNAFGDGRLYLEKLLSGMRHVEVQVVGDGLGNGVHLFERDCTLQRRRQKLIEEAPASLVDPDMREAMHKASVSLVRHLAYRGAGTVEFLVRKSSFYFMEMNARLQVEHGVTEMITGTDLVSAQLDVAAGRGLPWEQENISRVGHAVECRINAEDPNTGEPCPGMVSGIVFPAGPGIRVDSDLANGSKIPIWYDSLVAKILAHAETREKARHRMLRALDEFSIDGIVTNVSAQRKHVLEDAFVRATV